MTEETKTQPEDAEEEDAILSAAEKIAESTTENEEPLTLEEQLKKSQAECKEQHGQFLRAKAEMENVRKRVQKEMVQERLYAPLPFVRDLLPGLDNLKRTLEAAKTSQNIEELTKGVEIVLKQFEDMLSNHAVTPIGSIGESFDPNIHEALQQVPSPDRPAMSIIDEVESGYRLHDRVVRPSKVIVSSGTPADETKEATQDES